MQIYLAKPGGPKEGPYSLQQINADLALRKYRDDDYWAWHQGLSDWVPLYAVGGVCGAADTTFFFAKPVPKGSPAPINPPAPPTADTSIFTRPKAPQNPIELKLAGPAAGQVAGSTPQRCEDFKDFIAATVGDNAGTPLPGAQPLRVSSSEPASAVTKQVACSDKAAEKCTPCAAAAPTPAQLQPSVVCHRTDSDPVAKMAPVLGKPLAGLPKPTPTPSVSSLLSTKPLPSTAPPGATKPVTSAAVPSVLGEPPAGLSLLAQEILRESLSDTPARPAPKAGRSAAPNPAARKQPSTSRKPSKAGTSKPLKPKASKPHRPRTSKPRKPKPPKRRKTKASKPRKTRASGRATAPASLHRRVQAKKSRLSSCGKRRTSTKSQPGTSGGRENSRLVN